jgi:hypothetical protein
METAQNAAVAWQTRGNMVGATCGTRVLSVYTVFRLPNIEYTAFRRSFQALWCGMCQEFVGVWVVAQEQIRG